MNTDIRTAQSPEMQAVKQLWSLSFNDFDPYLSWYFDNISACENTVVAEHDGKILSSLQLIDYTFVSDKTYDAYYITGVCTLPEYRRLGLGGKILDFAFETAKTRGKDFVFLCPAIDGYYEKFGFKFWHSCTQHLSDFSFIKPDLQMRCKKACIADIPLLKQMYSVYAKEFSGYFIRSDIDFIRIMQLHEMYEGGIYIVTDNKNIPIGYFVFEISDGTLNITETVIFTTDAFDCMTNFAKTKPSQKITIRSVYGSMVHNYLNKTDVTFKPSYLIKPITAEFRQDNNYINILY